MDKEAPSQSEVGRRRRAQKWGHELGEIKNQVLLDKARDKIRREVEER
jgi:hypothetical protein